MLAKLDECENPLNILFWNLNVLTAEQAVWLERLARNVDLVLGVETGRDDPFELAGFVCFPGLPRANRSTAGAGRGQGMAVWVRQQYAPHCVCVKRTDYYMWLRLAAPGHRVMFVCVVYLPPSSSVVEWQHGSGWLQVFADLHVDITAFQALGSVCVFGDFNARTSTMDESSVAAQQLLDAMGVPAGPATGATTALTPRCNSDASPPCGFGRQLLSLCASTGLAILNGRASGDAQGAATHVSRSGVGSVIDYGLASRCLLPHVARFMVMADGTSLMSDHHALVCVVDWPAAPQQPLKAGFVPISTPCVMWDPDKREQYVGALSANQQEQLRVSIIGAMQGDQLSVTEAFTQWSAAVCDVASGVFGVTVKRTGRMQDG